ncbi:hypothetical protein SKAU_G00323350 [Synaphobranchus kaupii]|uniref:GLTSCR protein conserved domain-containing protein n=1 Tax=Synaphobranchus kaupii TaxID=118154 RepID=A0A9Q1IJS1_SYNKA|nr:hypothetical protein SKAU_G00323350 [Synaphobranchus kaupii]
METRAGLCRRPRATCTSIVSVDMDDEDGRCLLDVICDPQALNDFLHGSETHGHVPVVPTSIQLSASVPAGVPSGSVDLDFLEDEDEDILGGSPGGGGSASGEPCDILQQSLAEANITEQSLQEAEAELDLGAFAGAFPGLTQVVQSLPDAAGAGVGIGVGVSGSAQIFPGAAVGPTAAPPGASQDVIGLQLQPQLMNKAISVQPFMQQVGLGNVTLQSISGLQALPNGSQSGHLGIGQIQVVSQPTVMTINQSGQPILAKTMGGYQLHQPGPETGAAGAQARLGASVLSPPGAGGLLIQGGKAALGSPALNGAVVGVSCASTSSSSSTLTSSGGLLGFGGTPLGAGLTPQQKALNQAALMQNVIIQRTPTPIQPKPPQGGVIQPRLPAAPALQNDGAKSLAAQQSQVPVSSSQNVAFLTGKPGGNVVLSTQAGPQGTTFPQALFKQQGPHGAGKPLSVHLLNQSGSIVIPSQTVLQGQGHQFLLPQLQAGGQILTQHPGGHIITSQGPGGQLIANQILAANQNLNLGQVLTPQGHPGTAHILSGHIQLQPGQMGHPTLFQMPVSLAQTQAQAHPGTGSTQTVIQGMPMQNSLAMLSQVEGLGPTVSLQAGGIPGAPVLPGQCQPGEGADQAAHPAPPPSILTVQTASSVSVPASSLSSSSPSPSSSSSSSSAGIPVAANSPGKLLLAQAPGMILSHESLQMFLQQEQQQRRTESASPPSGCAPASVIVSSSAGPAPSAEGWPGQSSAHPVDPTNMAAVVYQPDARPSSCSPKPPQAPPVQFQFAAPPGGVSLGAVAKPQVPLLSLTTEQQHTLQLVSAQLQTLSAIGQPSPQQKQLLDRLHQVQHSIILQAKQQALAQVQMQMQPQTLTLAPSQFSSQQDPPTALPVTSSASANTSLLHQTSVLVKTPATVCSEVTVFPGAPQVAVPAIKAEVTPVSLMQSVQVKQGVISSAGALQGGLQVVGSGLPQMNTPQPPAPTPPTQTQTTTLKMPFSMKPSKEASMLEQLRKQQGSVLHPDYGSPFGSYGDALQRLIPYHLYQGTPSSLQDYCRVDAEFESVSGQLLKRTQAMLDKYRLLLFEESKQRLGPSAEMVMIDRMFIQEEKSALNQDRVLARERPDEYAALQNTSVTAQHPSSAEPCDVKPVVSITGNLTATPSPVPAPAPTPAPAHFAPTKLVIKQGGGGASVSWSTSSTPIPAARQGSVGQAPPLSSTPASSRPVGGDDDEDALPQRSGRPPMKTYEARRRIGLKLKIKQEAGFSKVVHNTALDPVHAQPHPQPQPQQRSPQGQQQPRSTVPTATIVRTSPRPGASDTKSAVAAATAPAGPAQSNLPPSSSSSSLPSSSSSSSTSTSTSSSSQINGTLEHHEVGGAKRNPASTTPPITCRLPLRKTYRANISPPVRPGVVGGGGAVHPPPRPPDALRLSPVPSPPGRTVIASVKVENRGTKGHPQAHTNANAGAGGGAPNASANAQGSSPGLMQELAEVEEAFYRGIIKNRHPPHRPRVEEEEEESEDREEGAGTKRVQGRRGG